MPAWLRAFIFVAVPLFALHGRWFASRESLAKGLVMDDMLSFDEMLRFNPETMAMTRVILGCRDAKLLRTLDEQLDSHGGSSLRIAVVYGAAHMRAVIRHLGRRGYVTEGGGWLRVFSL